MLIKLFKHEFKATGRIFLPMYALLVVFSVITKYVNQNMRVDSLLFGILSYLPTLMYICIIAGICMMTLVLLIQRFFKNLLGPEGYLMHTLPVRPWQHVACKLLTSTFWSISSMCIVSLSSLYMGVNVQDWHSFIATFRGMLAVAAAPLNLTANAFFWGLIAVLVAYVIKMTLMIYAGLGIGQLSSKRKVGASVLAIVGLNIVEQLAAVIVLVLWGESSGILSHGSGAEIIRFVFWWIMGSAGLFSVIYAFVCNWMLKRNLNLA
ncbi:MAG: hypothetical protein FWD25_04140 [Clostridia bacterium]|nr:hypothetical protein [Clostridia bacterium]